jgi:hypothetical protein
MMKLNQRSRIRTRVSSQGDYCCSATELCADMPESDRHVLINLSLLRVSQTCGLTACNTRIIRGCMISLVPVYII